MDIILGVTPFATYFYKLKELSTFLAFFWSTLNIASVISALLAAAILNMRGVDGKPGWFWLFLSEGHLTFVLGLIGFLYLPQSLVQAKAFSTVSNDIVSASRSSWSIAFYSTILPKD
jgi:hypothetical protein